MYCEIFTSRIGSDQPPEVITQYDPFRLAGIVYHAAREFKGELSLEYLFDTIDTYIYNSGTDQAYIYILLQKSTRSETFDPHNIHGIALVRYNHSKRLGKELVIDLMAVKQDWHLGSVLFTHLLDDAKKRGCKIISLRSLDGEQTRRFYQGKGFVPDNREMKHTEKNRRRGEVPLVLFLDKTLPHKAKN